jgi:hypothetical protein
MSSIFGLSQAKERTGICSFQVVLNLVERFRVEIDVAQVPVTAIMISLSKHGSRPATPPAGLRLNRAAVIQSELEKLFVEFQCSF